MNAFVTAKVASSAVVVRAPVAEREVLFSEWSRVIYIFVNCMYSWLNETCVSDESQCAIFFETKSTYPSRSAKHPQQPLKQLQQQSSNICSPQYFPHFSQHPSASGSRCLGISSLSLSLQTFVKRFKKKLKKDFLLMCCLRVAYHIRCMDV